MIVVSAGYSAAFLLLAGVAGAGLLLFWFAMPETHDTKQGVTQPMAAQNRSAPAE